MTHVSDSVVAQDLGPLDEVVEALKRGMDEDLVAVVLFGSRARGEAHEGSDWDLLVIARHLPDRTLQRYTWVKAMLPPARRGEISILSKTPAEFTERLPSLFLDVAVDGVVLYDTDDYASTHLAHLRKSIAEMGLRRETDDQDMNWRWDHFPGFDWSLEWGVSR